MEILPLQRLTTALRVQFFIWKAEVYSDSVRCKFTANIGHRRFLTQRIYPVVCEVHPCTFLGIEENFHLMFKRDVGMAGLSWDLGKPQEEWLGPQV